MSSTTASANVRPVSLTRMTHYYQGRPNVMFLDRYQTVVDRRAVT